MSSARVGSAAALLVLIVSLTACGSGAPSSSADQAQPPAPAPAASATPAPADPPAAVPRPTGEWHEPVALTDSEIPPLPVTPFAPSRPIEVVRAVYTFAARHPEVLSRVPCFCGCESRGHRHNDDCFVAARDARGRPTAWEPHGIG
jgi:hypothetical protein